MRSVAHLYKTFQPEHYTLLLKPDAVKMTFTGTVTIRGKKAGRPSQRITFHQHGISVTTASIIRRDKKGEHEIPVKRINNQETLDEVRLHAGTMIYPGEYDVRLEFRGTITRNMTGLYPCFFTIDGQSHTLLMTQFESHHAREAFPCIDEPEAKASFDLTLVAPTDQVVLANTPVKRQQADEPGKVATTFETTPRMSTYLLAFAIGELQGKTAQTKRGTDVTVWATVAQPPESLAFALDVAKRSIEYFEHYFGIPYPLPKADHLAVPDFTAGAMENWGLITYRERVLLAYPDETSQSILEHIALTIAHETSHQWFGNLVTMKWWDDLWLNESFADLMMYQAVDTLFPKWQVWDTFVTSEGLAALRRDAVMGVQAVKASVHHPDEISTLFDHAIVYAKGGRLLYMLKQYIGDDAFRKGLTAYFKQYAYRNTTGNDLWQSLTESSGADIAGFMNPWLTRPGFPAVIVDQLPHGIQLQQTHFLETGFTDDAMLWPIPLFSNYTGLPPRLDKKVARRTVKITEPVLVNQHFAGHYLVHYSQPQHREQIVELIRQGKLDTTDRLMLLNNASMLARAGVQSLADTLQLMDAYNAEQSEVVWNIIALVIGEARRFIELDDQIEKPIKAYIRNIIRSEYERLGWEEQSSDTAADRKLRATILGLGSYADEPEIVQEAVKRYERYKLGTQIPAELRSIVFAAAVRQRVDGVIGYLLDLHDRTANSDLKADIMGGLTSTTDPETAVTLLGRLTDSELTKPQDADYWLIYLLRNRHTRETAWQWMEDQWNWIVATYAHDMSYDDFPRYAASACSTRAWQQRFDAFFDPKQDDPGLKRNIAIGKAEIKTRVLWLERDLASVTDFFKHY